MMGREQFQQLTVDEMDPLECLRIYGEKCKIERSVDEIVDSLKRYLGID